MSASAPHIEARAGHLYLLADGRRARVTEARAHTVYFRIEGEASLSASGRSWFERSIESVLE